MNAHTIHNGQSIFVSADQWDSDALAFSGTGNTAGQTPTVSFTGPNALSGISDIGVAGTPGFGAINLQPGSVLSTGGLTVRNATLYITERAGTTVTLNGTTSVANTSTLTASGIGGLGHYTVNGTMNIDGSSTVNMDYVALAGSGTIHLTGENALLRAGTVGSGETVVLDGGMLSLNSGMNFLGTITDSASSASRIGPIASVSVYNALDAVQETFDRTTGVLGLFNAQGAQIANLKFAGTGDLYAVPTSRLATNYTSITSHPSAGALPVSFTG